MSATITQVSDSLTSRVFAAIQSQGWTVDRHLRNPDIVYQFSLRMGASYEATCWGLLCHQILPQGDQHAMGSTPMPSRPTRDRNRRHAAASFISIAGITWNGRRCDSLLSPEQY
jgi:hypothetical protein